MKKKYNFDILMIMFGFTFFSGSKLIGQTLSNWLNLIDFILCIFIGKLEMLDMKRFVEIVLEAK